MKNYLILIFICFNCIKLSCCQLGPCKATLTIEFGTLLGCVMRGGREWVDVKCDVGYEFALDTFQNSFEVDTLDGNDIRCKPTGCRTKDTVEDTNAEELAQDHLAIKGVTCIQAPKEGYCLPDVSYIQFECMPGYTKDPESGDLKVKCLISYLWDTDPMCIKDEVPITTPKPTKPGSVTFKPVPDCWKNLPLRPINAQRKITLKTGPEKSIITFSCNTFYDRKGPGVIYCTDGKWDTARPTCELSSMICTQKPALKIGTAQLISLTSSTIKHEWGRYMLIKIKLYTVASYACPGNNFKVDNKDNMPNKIRYKWYKGQEIGYMNFKCNGKEQWEGFKCS